MLYFVNYYVTVPVCKSDNVINKKNKIKVETLISIFHDFAIDSQETYKLFNIWRNRSSGQADY